MKTIALTPFSREELPRACTLDPDAGELERARRFYIRARQVRTGLAQTATLGRWANCKETSRAGMSGVVSRWLGGVEQMDVICQRLLRVQIENRPATDVLQLYDSPRTLFYCDPPYVHETRGDSKAYKHEMTDDQHAELADVLNSVKARVALSNYEPAAGPPLSAKTLVHDLRLDEDQPFHQGQTQGSTVDQLRPVLTYSAAVWHCWT